MMLPAGGGVEGWHRATLGHRLRPHRPWLQIRASQLRDDASCAGTRRAGQELPAVRGCLGAAGGEATPGQCAGRWQLHCYLPVLCSGRAASATATTAAEISRQVDSQGDHISLWLWSRHCRSYLNSCGCRAENQRPVTTYSLFQAVCNLHVGAKLPNQTWPTVQMVVNLAAILQGHGVTSAACHGSLNAPGFVSKLGIHEFRDSGVQNGCPFWDNRHHFCNCRLVPEENWGFFACTIDASTFWCFRDGVVLSYLRHHPLVKSPKTEKTLPE